MNENLWKYLVGIVSFIIYSGFLVFSGYQYSDAAHAKEAVEVSQAMARLGNVIQKQSSEQAEITRDQQMAEKGRINAISTNHHKTKKIALLERKLAQALREQPARYDNAGNLQNAADGRYHVFDADAIERLWNNASGNSVPTSGLTTTVQTRPGQIAISRTDTKRITGKW